MQKWSLSKSIMNFNILSMLHTTLFFQQNIAIRKGRSYMAGILPILPKNNHSINQSSHKNRAVTEDFVIPLYGSETRTKSAKAKIVNLRKSMFWNMFPIRSFQYTEYRDIEDRDVHSISCEYFVQIVLESAHACRYVNSGGCICGFYRKRGGRIKSSLVPFIQALNRIITGASSTYLFIESLLFESVVST